MPNRTCVIFFLVGQGEIDILAKRLSNPIRDEHVINSIVKRKRFDKKIKIKLLDYW